MNTLIERLGKYFNPRSHERSDRSDYCTVRYSTDFNPRSHERSDVVCARLVVTRLLISIHAPTRGATVLVLGKTL